MYNAQTVLSHHSNSRQVDPARLGQVLVQWLTRLFGCWHTAMSRPFTHDKETYRVCLDCGARRDFDPLKWEMVGAYYYGEPSTSGLYRIEQKAQTKGRRAALIRLAA